MRATRFNHVSVHASSVDHSVLPELKRPADSLSQTGDALHAALYLEKAEL